LETGKTTEGSNQKSKDATVQKLTEEVKKLKRELEKAYQMIKTLEQESEDHISIEKEESSEGDTMESSVEMSE